VVTEEYGVLPLSFAPYLSLTDFAENTYILAMLACKNPESIVLKFDMSCAAT
jgi:hypothetical protein